MRKLSLLAKGDKGAFMFDRMLVKLFVIAQHLPLAFLLYCARLTAKLICVFQPPSVRQLKRNLERVYRARSAQEIVSAHQLNHALKIAVERYFSYFVETMSVRSSQHEDILSSIRAEGPGLDAIMLDAQERKTSLIALGHQGNWDFAGLWANSTLNPVITVAERLSNQQLLQHFIDVRAQLGIKVLTTGEQNLLSQLKDYAMHEAVILPLLADRDLSRRGVFVRAFGEIIRVAPGPAILAYDLKKPLYVFNMYVEDQAQTTRHSRKRTRGYVCHISEPIDVTPYLETTRDDAIQAISQDWVNVWSQQIQEHPEDWHMMQPIFLEDLDRTRLHFDSASLPMPQQS